MRPARSVRPAVVAALAATALLAPLVPGGAARAATTRDLPASIVVTVSPESGCSLTGAFRQVKAGYDYCLALTRTGGVRASLYDGTTNPIQDVPTSLGTGTGTVELAAGYRHALALDGDGDVTTWGNWGDEPYDPETGEPTGDPAPPATVPQEVVDATITQVSAGSYHNLAITDQGTVLAWGLDPAADAVQVPSELAEQTVTQVVAGGNASVAITSTGHLVAWGYFNDEPVPTSLEEATVVAADVGDGWAMALTSTGDLVAWGNNSNGVTQIPADVATDGVTAFAASDYGAMAATPNGYIHYWGEDAFGLTPPRTGAPVADLDLGRYAAVATYAQLAPNRRPTVAGTARVGRTLTGTAPASWSETPASVTSRWRRDGVPIAGATGPTYALRPADAGRRITFAVVAVGPDGYDDTTSVSGPTAPVALAPTTLRVTAPRAVVRNRRVTVSAAGLASGERFTVTLDGRRVGTGTAGSAGVGRLTFVVPPATRLGSRPVVFTGSVRDRVGRRATSVQAR